LRDAINHLGFIDNGRIIKLFCRRATHLRPHRPCPGASVGRHITAVLRDPGADRQVQPSINLVNSNMYVQVALTPFCQHVMKG